MNGKMRVSIVATSLKGSTISPEPRPVLNVVSSSNNKNSFFSENLFSKSNTEKNIVNSIDGATALKLDENFEIKSSEEQNALIDNFESNEESKIAEEALLTQTNAEKEIPAGVSIESASYIENSEDLNSNIKTPEASEPTSKYPEEENTPKLFSEDQNQVNNEIKDLSEDNEATEQLFDQDTNEDEDFEIPAFLRRQKF